MAVVRPLRSERAPRDGPRMFICRGESGGAAQCPPKASLANRPDLIRPAEQRFSRRSLLMVGQLPAWAEVVFFDNATAACAQARPDTIPCTDPQLLRLLSPAVLVALLTGGLWEEKVGVPFAQNGNAFAVVFAFGNPLRDASG